MSTSSESRAAADMSEALRGSAGSQLGEADTSGSDSQTPSRVLPAATTTGIWIPGQTTTTPGYDHATSPVRQAAATAFDILGDQLPPVPLSAHRAEDRWGADAIGRAVSLLSELHVDRTSFGWRLTASAGKDERLEDSALGEAFDAIAECAEGFTGQIQLSLPGPWTLVTALNLGSGSAVLADHGARRDVIQAYAYGIAGFTEKLRRLGVQPTVRLVESRLHPVLTGTWPTVSGWRTLPAVAESQVYAALQSTLRHLPPTVLVLPDLRSVHLRGKEIPAAEVVRSTGANAVSVPLATLKAHGWEQLAMIAEAGLGTWLHLPVGAGSRPQEVKHWTQRITQPWTRIGMGAATLHDFGIVAGPELPLGHPPLLDEHAPTTSDSSQATMMIAAGVRRALEETE